MQSKHRKAPDHDARSTLPSFLKPFWENRFRLDWQFGLVLILLFGIPRFLLVMRAYVDGSFQWVSLVFLIMMIVPYVLLTKFGRMSIGLIRPGNPHWLLIGFAGGVLIAALMYFLGEVMYGDSLKNWFVYISQSYEGQRQLANPDMAFGMVALVTMTFSPLGEELFYRGVVHQAFVR